VARTVCVVWPQGWLTSVRAHFESLPPIRNFLVRHTPCSHICRCSVCYACVNTYTHTLTHTHAHTHTHTHSHTHTHTLTHTCIYTRTCTNVKTHTLVFAQSACILSPITFTRTYARTHAHTRTPFCSVCTYNFTHNAHTHTYTVLHTYTSIQAWL